MSTELSRRGFLKFSALVLGSLAFDPGKFTPEEQQERWQMPVEFRFGDHLLHLEDIDPERYSLILGETSQADIWGWHQNTDTLKDTDSINMLEVWRDRIIHVWQNGGVGSTDYDRNIHLKSLILARDKGVQISATDVLFNQTVSPEEGVNFEEEITKFLIKEGLIGVGGVIGVTVPTYINFCLRSYKDWEDTGQVKIIDTFKRLAPLPAAYYLLYRYREDLAKLTGNKTQNKIYDFVTHTRNTTMSCNIRLIEDFLRINRDIKEQLDLGNGKKKVLFYAGNSHNDVRNVYSKERDILLKKISKDTKSDINFALNYLKMLKENPDLEISEEKLLNLFVLITSAYSFPIATFYNNDQYKYQLPRMDLHASPRWVLWNNLFNLFYEASDEERPIVKNLIACLTREDMEFFSSSERSSTPEKDAMFSRMKMLRERSEVLFEGNLDQFLEGYEIAELHPKIIVSEGIPFVTNEI